MPSPPAMVDLEPTARCNLRCGFCHVPGWERAKLPDMTLEMFDRILAALPSLISIKIQGMGEPFLNRDLCEMIARANRNDIAVTVITNGTILDGRMLDALFRSPPAFLLFSLDTADPNIFRSMRGADMHGRVLENIRGAVRRKKRRADNPVVGLWSLLTRDTAGGIGDLACLAGELGVDEMTCQTHLTGWGKKHFLEVARSLEVDVTKEGQRRILDSAGRLAGERGVRFRIHEGDRYSRRNPCPWPKRSAYITVEGEVVPCCMIADPGVISMGNALGEGFDAVWNGGNYREFRARLDRLDLPEFCARCYRR